jgi:uncharacterized RDD family membrane protein YckC
VNCPKCSKEVLADRLFCTWCDGFIPNQNVGTKAGLFRRWVVTAIDPLLAIVLYFIVAGILGAAASALGQSATVGAIIIVTIFYGVFYLWLLSKGMTPGKWLLDDRVVEKIRGDYPGFWKMFLREVIGKFISGLFLGLGYLWAIWDKDNQAWHDKIAGTVVIKRGK